MVIVNSRWVRPAQALVYSDAGEIKLFPPRNRGSLPRALTFRDNQEWGDDGSEQQQNNRMTSLFEQGEEPASFLITSESENFYMEDPPDEYNSFESDYSKYSIARDADSYMDIEAPVMSTPTEQYLKNVLKPRVLPHPSVLSPKQQQCMSSASDTHNGCLSPLLQPDAGPFLSLDDLVDLYAKKLEDARVARLTKANLKNREKLNNSDNGDKVTVSRLNGIGEVCHAENSSNICNSSIHTQSQAGNKCSRIISNPTPLQLIKFDIQQLLEKLDHICGDQPTNSSYEDEDWLCISTEEFESLLMNCCKETIDFVMME